MISSGELRMRIINGYIGKWEELNLYTPTIDLFVGGISLEERCPQGWNLLKKSNINIRRKIMFYFKEIIQTKESNRIEKIIFDKLFDMTQNDFRIKSGLYDEIGGLREFEKCLDEINFNSIKRNIMIDISVMIKPYIFILLRYLLDIKKLRVLYLLYTEPNIYQEPKSRLHQKESVFFTKGTVKIGEIPGYSGWKDLKKRDILIILLGFEGNRAIEITNAIEPEITIPVNGFPAYRPEFKDISIISNEELLREPSTFKNLTYAPANDPFETNRVLESIHTKHSKDYNITLAPIGTKPMSLGSCLFALQHPECRIVYPYPTEYNLKVSKGFGNTWIYMIFPGERNEE